MRLVQKWCSFTTMTAGRRSGSGRSIRFRFENDWVLLLDADEVLTPDLGNEIREAIRDPNLIGYRVFLRLNFLGRELRFGGNGFWKLSLFRRGKGHFECRLKDQDQSMSDIEVHEHVIVDGRVGKLRHVLPHHNVESLDRYLTKHNEYSNWEAKVLLQETEQREALRPTLFGNQAQRRRWLKKRFFRATRFTVIFLFLQIHITFGFSGRSARLNLLRPPIHAFFPRQSENV